MYANESAVNAAVTTDIGKDKTDRRFHPANMRPRHARSSLIGRHACLVLGPRFNGGMPEPSNLTRRRSEDRQNCWHIYYGDVHAGTIAMRVGNPHDTEQREWICGFYPGSRPGEIQSGTAATFDEARAEFGSAWKIFFSTRTEADFQARRHQRDWTE